MPDVFNYYYVLGKSNKTGQKLVNVAYVVYVAHLDLI